MKPKFRSLIAAFHPLQRTAIVVTATVCAAAAHADQTWTGASDTLWDTAGNWNSAVPGAGENAVFDASSTANLSIDTNANQAVGGIVLSSPSGPVTISNNTLTLGSGGIDMSAATQNLTLASVVAPAGSQEWSVASGQLLTVSSTLTKPVHAVVNFDLSAGGTVNVATGTTSDLLPGATYNGVDLAALDGSNNVVSGDTVLTYTPNPTASNFFGPFVVADVVNDNDSPFEWTAFRLTTSTYLPDGGGIRFNANGSFGWRTQRRQSTLPEHRKLRRSWSRPPWTPMSSSSLR
ncbi:MAG: hypothetical protein H7A50_05075 [Akkermansiaceae bacterium]|nr:hypothetical protein [Akkermansiaceae bacterium]